MQGSDYPYRMANLWMKTIGISDSHTKQYLLEDSYMSEKQMIISTHKLRQQIFHSGFKREREREGWRDKKKNEKI